MEGGRGRKRGEGRGGEEGRGKREGGGIEGEEKRESPGSLTMLLIYSSFSLAGQKDLVWLGAGLLHEQDLRVPREALSRRVAIQCSGHGDWDGHPHHPLRHFRRLLLPHILRLQESAERT